MSDGRRDEVEEQLSDGVQAIDIEPGRVRDRVGKSRRMKEACRKGLK